LFPPATPSVLQLAPTAVEQKTVTPLDPVDKKFVIISPWQGLHCKARPGIGVVGVEGGGQRVLLSRGPAEKKT